MWTDKWIFKPRVLIQAHPKYDRSYAMDWARYIMFDDSESVYITTIRSRSNVIPVLLIL